MSRAVLSVLQNGSTAWKGSEFIQKEVYIMYAIIKTGGKQYRVSVGDVVYVEKLNAQEEENVEFDVIAVGKEDGMVVGTPVSPKRLLYSPTDPKKTANARWATDSHIPKLRSLLSTHNDPCRLC